MERKIVTESLTTEQIAERIIYLVKNGNKVTLDAKTQWYIGRVVNPKKVYIPVGAFCFDNPVNIKKLTKLLEAEGIYLSEWPDVRHVFLVDTVKHENFIYL